MAKTLEQYLYHSKVKNILSLLLLSIAGPDYTGLCALRDLNTISAVIKVERNNEYFYKNLDGFVNDAYEGWDQIGNKENS